MHVPQEGLAKTTFPMWFMSVCARWLSFTLNKEHACKQGFLANCCAYQMSGCPFYAYAGRTGMMCLDF